MSEIRDRIIKILEESKISFMEDENTAMQLDVIDDENFKEGQRVRISQSAENFQGEEGVIIASRVTDFGTPFYTVKLDNGEPYDVLATNIEPVLEEGWKDNLKKGLATAAVAGSLLGSNPANAQSIPSDFNDGAQANGQFTAYNDEYESPLAAQYQAQNGDIEVFAKENEFVKNEDGTYTDKYGTKFSEDDVRALMNGEDPFGESIISEAQKQFGVQYRDMHTAIHNLIVTDDEKKAREIFGLLNELEIADEVDAHLIWDKISKLSNNSYEINYRNINNDGIYDDVKVINTVNVPDIWG